jgi:hypothetical protein
VRRIVALGCVLVTLASCAGSDEVSGDRRVVGGVTVTFTVRPARVEAGETVTFALRIANIAGRAAELTFPSSKQYDFWVMRGREEVWRWSEGRLFTQAIEKRTIDPQGSLTLTEPWKAEPTGAFTVHGELHADGYRRDLTGELRVGR